MLVIRRLAVAALVALSVALVSGCGRRYEFPNVLYPPTVVGVIETASLDGRGWHVTLVDGRVRDLLEVMNAHGLTGHGGQTDAGNLFLEGAADDGVWWVLLPALGDGCWEAYGNPSSNPMVWDTGSSIVFMDGLELPKAAGFWAVWVGCSRKGTCSSRASRPPIAPTPAARSSSPCSSGPARGRRRRPPDEPTSTPSDFTSFGGPPTLIARR